MQNFYLVELFFNMMTINLLTNLGFSPVSPSKVLLILTYIQESLPVN